MAKTWFITGTSSGFGRHLTELLLERGDRVAATLRNPRRLDDLAAKYGDRLWVRDLDVTDTAAMRRVVDEAFADLGRIDVIISNAGYGLLGAAEELGDDQIDRQLATNLVAPIQLARAVTPHLRAQGGGRFLQVSSMGGHLTFPGFSMYHTSKWGVEGFFDSFAKEVAPFGILTTLIEPGVIGTDFFEPGGSSDIAPAMEIYAGSPASWFRDGVTDPKAMPGDPRRTAQAMIDVGDAENPPNRQLLGSDAYVVIRDAMAERMRVFESGLDLAKTADRDGVA
jgi:NAD(P)-dependent dehydrogenase (short-subunit alcohol dehydrogenase family)